MKIQVIIISSFEMIPTITSGRKKELTKKKNQVKKNRILYILKKWIAQPKSYDSEHKEIYENTYDCNKNYYK